ncbi:MAG TPA: PepSY-associated TM helix domain-containing protein [Blastocatellia bacterium]|nr:PepSY-associated TM helix domain-containing protein [Blastocatellia bacterium]
MLTRVLFQIHLWGGLALGLYVFFIGLTGSVLVFHEEISHRMSPRPRIAATESTPKLEQIRAGIQASYPDWHPWSLEAPWEPGEPWGSYLLKSGGGKMVFADAEGRVVGEVNNKGTWLELCEQFHSFLLLPKGRLYNGIAGLVLVGLALSGLYLWWPARGKWNTAFRIVRRSNWKGWVYDLHRVGGALMLGFIVLSGITGGYFTWPAVYKDIAAALLPTKPKPKPAAVLTEGTRLPIDQLVAAAQQAVPETRLVRVLVPNGNKQAVTVVLAHGSTKEDRNRNTSQLTMHPYSGAVLALDDYRERRVGDDVVSWIGPLHTGHFGGLWVKVIWALAGLSFPALFITGFLMWCNRVLAPRLARRKVHL